MMEYTDRANEDENITLLVCPFCGQYPSIETWHAHPETMPPGPEVIITCDNVDCRVAPKVISNNFDHAAEWWNSRHPPLTPEGLRQKICLAYQGDTVPCATACLHCHRIARALS